MIAHEPIAVELADALAAEAAAVRFSRDETDGSEDFFIPPLNNADQLAQVSRAWSSRVPSIARRVLRGGARRRRGGLLLPADRGRGRPHDDEIVQTEIFGPVITVQ